MPRYTPLTISSEESAAIQAGALDVLDWIGSGENPASRAKRVMHEDKLHRSIYQFARLALPPDAMFVTWENRVGSLFEGADRKRRGQKRGWFDAGVLWRATVIFFEIKSARGSLSIDQIACHEQVRLLGFKVYVVRALEQFRDALETSGIALRAEIAA